MKLGLGLVVLPIQRIGAENTPEMCCLPMVQEGKRASSLKMGAGLVLHQGCSTRNFVG